MILINIMYKYNYHYYLKMYIFILSTRVLGWKYNNLFYKIIQGLNP